MDSYNDFISFPTRRSVVHSTNGIVSCTQPLAATAGLRVLQAGGNAADAAIAAASVLGVTEPTSTGIGGDLFCLFYDAKTRTIRGLNASGRSPGALTLERALEDLAGCPSVETRKRMPLEHAHCVTVPGCAAGWCDVVETFGSGKLDMKEVLKDAIRLAEEGYPVHELAARMWDECKDTLISQGEEQAAEMLLPGNRAPRTGEVMRLPGLAKVMRRVAEKGRKGFYEGETAEKIVEAVQKRGGLLDLADLKRHGDMGSELTQPIGLEWGGLKVWECAPNGQGIVALMALGIMEELEKTGKIGKIGESLNHNDADYLHALIESLRIAFSDGHFFIADPATNPAPLDHLLSPSYLSQRANLFSPTQCNKSLKPGSPAQRSCDTVYLSVTDRFGNGCSLINSTYGGFGSGIIPHTCGFNLQNRGGGFTLDPERPNVLAPNKRPYHTIIPGMLTTAGEQGEINLKAVFGVMGGFMQPQGHVQVLHNLIKFKHNPQHALDAPRICIGENYDPGVPIVYLEEGVNENVARELEKRGHEVKIVKGFKRGHFGRGQIVWVDKEEVEEPIAMEELHGNEEKKERWVFAAGSDMRGDGQSVGY
ncbi:gamma-glutamyltranspeptidase [Ascodesmis nigricans]|uniref:Gamma-glutamyltranspeptidase n=1 Tax=Ascodesmis nigricans TaxID=341454 RepID=A0A4S2MNX9_9PEZI|nr:gamma-glutamyltranspeptidase [Ascodesmis nigricans]